MQFRHASAHYISKNWELLSILMITYDFTLAMTKEFWAVFMIYWPVAHLTPQHVGNGEAGGGEAPGGWRPQVGAPTRASPPRR